jgi:hypothetical protein
VFGLIHAFNLRLVVATFLLELAIVPLFLLYRNLWPLGLLHGWAVSSTSGWKAATCGLSASGESVSG